MSGLMLLQRASLSRSVLATTSRSAHTVSVIMLPSSTADAASLATVKPGQMRNVLYPQKLAIYATHENKLKYDLVDALDESALAAAASSAADAASAVEATPAEKLTIYLSTRIVKIPRKISGANKNLTRPVHVDESLISQTLFKQHKVKLWKNEKIHLPKKEMTKEAVESGQLFTAHIQLGAKEGSPKVPFQFQVKVKEATREKTDENADAADDENDEGMGGDDEFFFPPDEEDLAREQAIQEHRRLRNKTRDRN
jgi:hypothetical protein